MLRWLLFNVCDTDLKTHADVQPLDLPVSRDIVFQRLPAIMAGLTGWKLIEAVPDTGVVRATRQTRVFRFTDDITLRIEPGSPGCRVHARSKSRVGQGDLGQNRRNLLELFAALNSQLGQK